MKDFEKLEKKVGRLNLLLEDRDKKIVTLEDRLKKISGKLEKAGAMGGLSIDTLAHLLTTDDPRVLKHAPGTELLGQLLVFHQPGICDTRSPGDFS